MMEDISLSPYQSFRPPLLGTTDLGDPGFSNLQFILIWPEKVNKSKVCIMKNSLNFNDSETSNTKNVEIPLFDKNRGYNALRFMMLR